MCLMHSEETNVIHLNLLVHNFDLSWQLFLFMLYLLYV
jgi:hypothetical protein